MKFLCFFKMRMTSFGEEEVVHKCEATGGNFGKDVSDFITTDENLGCGVSVTPIDACGPIHVGLSSSTLRIRFFFRFQETIREIATTCLLLYLEVIQHILASFHTR